jgi:hypothetical protein
MIRIRLCHTILDIPGNCEEDILNIEVCFGTLHATPCLHIKDCLHILKKQDWEEYTKHAETASCFLHRDIEGICPEVINVLSNLGHQDQIHGPEINKTPIQFMIIFLCYSGS